MKRLAMLLTLLAACDRVVELSPPDAPNGGDGSIPDDAGLDGGFDGGTGLDDGGGPDSSVDAEPLDAL